MDDILSIIGISSLVAAVVSVVLGIVKDVFVEKYRFKRQSEADYIKNQIQIYSLIHLLLKRLEKGVGSYMFFGNIDDNIKELNDKIKENSSLLEPRIRNEWLDYMKIVSGFFSDPNPSMVYKEQSGKLSKKILFYIEEIMNKTLIPKYRKIAGETVPALE